MKRKEIEELLTVQWIYYSIPCIVKIETLSKKQRMNKRSIYMEKKTIRQTGLEVIRRLENEEELQAFSEFQQKLRYFKKRFEDEEFRIAVVGEFSSGKSTFINALIGQDVLQHAKKETPHFSEAHTSLYRHFQGQQAYYRHSFLRQDKPCKHRSAP